MSSRDFTISLCPIRLYYSPVIVLFNVELNSCQHAMNKPGDLTSSEMCGRSELRPLYGAAKETKQYNIYPFFWVFPLPGGFINVQAKLKQKGFVVTVSFTKL